MYTMTFRLDTKQTRVGKDSGIETKSDVSDIIHYNSDVIHYNSDVIHYNSDVIHYNSDVISTHT